MVSLVIIDTPVIAPVLVLILVAGGSGLLGLLAAVVPWLAIGVTVCRGRWASTNGDGDHGGGVSDSLCCVDFRNV